MMRAPLTKGGQRGDLLFASLYDLLRVRRDQSRNLLTHPFDIIHHFAIRKSYDRETISIEDVSSVFIIQFAIVGKMRFSVNLDHQM